MTDLVQSAYLLGRTIGKLAPPYGGSDQAFGATRLDKNQLENADFSHCTFVNISFKEVTLRNSSFLNCVYIGCYFRRADLVNSKFIGCKFIDCNFNHIAIRSCDFRHSTFHACQLPFSELRHSLPSEPNLREELARNLSLESSRLGLSIEARHYRMTEIRAREAHLKAAIMSESKWYKEHFDLFARASAFIQLALSLANRWLWGYGERAWVLIRNLILLGAVIFPLIFWIFREGFVHATRSEIGLLDTFFFSLQNILPTGVQSEITAVAPVARLAAGLEGFFGVVAIALFASYVFRWSLHR